jgi:hypothetical protein
MCFEGQSLYTTRGGNVPLIIPGTVRHRPLAVEKALVLKLSPIGGYDGCLSIKLSSVWNKYPSVKAHKLSSSE